MPPTRRRKQNLRRKRKKARLLWSIFKENCFRLAQSHCCRPDRAGDEPPAAAPDEGSENSSEDEVKTMIYKEYDVALKHEGSHKTL